MVDCKAVPEKKKNTTLMRYTMKLGVEATQPDFDRAHFNPVTLRVTKGRKGLNVSCRTKP